MGNTRENRFTVHQRLAASEARMTALEAENKQLRQWVLGELSTKINDAKNLIQDSIRIPVDGRNGRDGVSIVGPAGPKGDRGDCLIPNDSEVAAALIALRQKHAAALARIQDALVKNSGRKHSGIKKVLEAELQLIASELK